MESPAETKKPSVSNKTIIIVAVLVVAAVVAIAAMVIFSRKPDDKKIGYATEAKVMLDQDSLQAAMDEAVKNAAEGNVSLRYQNDAYSDDGTNFECRIIDSASNIYDMYLTIFTDAQLTDQVFLSELVPPGSGFESITLDHTLDSGDHTVFVVLTQVDTDEDGQQVLKNQITHTMDFHVS